jgi:hypothetical protein
VLADGLHEILFEGGDQTIRHLPPVRVASATYLIEDLFESAESDDREVAGGAATPATGNTTTVEDAGPGTENPRLLEVVTTDGFEDGDHIEVSSEEGTELARIVDVGTTRLLLSAELAARHPGEETTVRGALMSCVFPSAIAADEETHESDHPLRVTWTYTIGGTIHRAVEQIRVVKFRFSDQNLTSIEDAMRDLYPAVVLHMRGTTNSMRDFVRRAARQIKARLDALGVDTGQFLPGSVGHEIAVAKCVEICALNGIFPHGFNAEGFLDAARADFAHVWKDLTGRPKNVVDVQRDGDTANTAHTTALRNMTLRP